MTKPSEELRSAMPEETKPVEREAQELMEALHDLYGHTFDVLGEEAIKYKLQASTDAALERAAQIVKEHSTECWSEWDDCADAIRALKGSR